MNSYVLLHGAWHGAWCWYKLRPILEAAGHNVATPELPGHGNDTTPARSITAQDYVETLRSAVLAQEQPVILVGHSMAGMVISQLAEYLPDRIKNLVYLSGFMLGSGQCIRDVEAMASRSLISPNLVLSRDRYSLIVPDNLLRDAFYNDCSEEDAAFAMHRLKPEPARPFLAPVSLSRAGYGSVPRIYIECLLDKSLPVTAQREMVREAGCQKLYSLNTGHSAFFSQYQELGRILLEL